MVYHLDSDVNFTSIVSFEKIMSATISCELVTFALLSILLFTHQLPASTYASSSKYLITRSDVHEVLSKIIKPTDQIVLLSDFDGTVSDINSNSNLSTIRPEAKAALEQLAIKPKFFVGFISGRKLTDLKEKIGLNGVTYSGNHGLEILFPNNTVFHYSIAPDLSENRIKIKKTIENEYVNLYGGWAEDKNLTLSYHYDEIDESVKKKVIAEIESIVRRNGFVPMQGHNVVEIKPPVNWTKGHAAQLILDDAFGTKWEKKVHVLYMGDDTSDEDVMSMLKDRSTTTFRITADPNLKTHASYRIMSVDTNGFILEWLVNNIQN